MALARRFRGLPELRERLARIPWWGWVGAAGALAFLFFRRKEISVLSGRIVKAGQEALFAAALPSRAKPFAHIVLRVAEEQGVDPFLLAAIAQRESNWDPNVLGDAGHGHGLMQIDDRSFGPWLAANNWRDPYTNLTKGAQVLKGKLAFLAGTSSVMDGSTPLVRNGFVYYRGSVASRYGLPDGTMLRDPRPLHGEQLSQAAIAAFNTGELNVLRSITAGAPIDKTTAHGNYSTDVLARMYSYASKFLG